MNELADLALGCLIATLPLALILGTCVAIELISPKDRYSLRDRLPGALLVLAMPLLAIPLAGPLRSIWQMLEFVPILDLTGLPPALLVAYLAISYDFVNYWEHRFEHRFLWPIHAVHHAPTELHAANAYFHPLQSVSLFVFHSLHYSLIEVESYELPVLVSLAIGFWALFVHSPTRVHLGPLRRIIVDPRFHRIHHSTEERHFDKNFAPVFSIWDQLFGTAHFPSEHEHPDVGIEGVTPPRSPWSLLVLPLRIMRPAAPAEPDVAQPAIAPEGVARPH